MKFSISTTHPDKQQQTCLMIGVFAGNILTSIGKKIDQNAQKQLTKLLKIGGFDGQIGQTLPLFHLTGTPYEHILLVGCGEPEKLTPAVFKKIVFSGVRSLAISKAIEATCYLTELNVPGRSIDWKVKQIVEATSEALYSFEFFKTKKTPTPPLKEIIIHIPTDADKKACEEALKQGAAISEGVMLAKNLANMPSNICTPTYLAEQAKALAKEYSSLSVKILEEKEMQKLGMGALLGVGQGSIEDSKLICLEYKGGKGAPIALIGKGVTFDTGGNSIKPADSMVGMKYDMCGAAAVLGTMKATAELKLPLHLVGIVPAVENMPGGTAYNPEDILTSMSGQTIEVISTDAEGRLILADAMTYALRYEPEVMIDIATLTGAVVIALGFQATGLLSNNETLAKDILRAGEESNDRSWQLPLWEEYQEQIKSPFADMANVGGRPAGTITAACFLSRFANKTPWAHLDVAGTAAMMMGTQERMATGRPVPSLIQYLINKAEK